MIKKSARLPAHIKPERYEIFLKPDLEGFTFTGEETMWLSLDKPSKAITLHAAELEVFSEDANVSYDQAAETVTLTFKKPISGKQKIKLKVTGILNDQMRGFYRSKYIHNGEEKYLATTQFESTDARRAFPCIDEPSAKAVFDVTLMVPKEKTVISNTIESEVLEHDGGYKSVKFESTPRMSTYLLAFIVGDFEYIEKKTKGGVMVRVFVTPGKSLQAKFALDVAVKTLDFYEDYFDIKYPLPVSDLIAIPDFAAGAMENWGAVTYRESAILVDPEKSSTANKQWVALVIAHELAHQWFGNLVTMEWWTHLWLNDGFASYIEYLAVDHIFPKWDIWKHFFSADLSRALKLDGLKYTHPIEVEVGHPGEISEIFDAVSYSKGASVIRMLADYLGEDDFRKGLVHYLKKHSYANTETGHLWQAFEKVAKKPVARMIRGWTQTAGYPLITVNKKDSSIHVAQSRFFSSPRSMEDRARRAPWMIPIRYAESGDKASRLTLLAKRNGRLGTMKKDSWLKLNAGETGFFPTNYPQELRERFAEPILGGGMPVGDRLGLIRDMAALAAAGHPAAVGMLGVSRHYHRETEYFVWLEMAGALKQTYLLIANEPFAPAYKEFAQGVFADIVGKVGWRAAPDENHTQKLLRNLVLSQFGQYGDGATIARAQKMFAGAAARRNKIAPDLRDVVYNLGAQNGGA